MMTLLARFPFRHRQHFDCESGVRSGHHPRYAFRRDNFGLFEYIYEHLLLLSLWCVVKRNLQLSAAGLEVAGASSSA
ncbi:MAG: hypothetical protein DMG68_03375 [Acidobacteria bacterium]|nr:MAG: hypothetical protein DMG68_03375 [Acidobacteriota bacterium]